MHLILDACLRLLSLLDAKAKINLYKRKDTEEEE